MRRNINQKPTPAPPVGKLGTLLRIGPPSGGRFLESLMNYFTQDEHAMLEQIEAQIKQILRLMEDVELAPRTSAFAMSKAYKAFNDWQDAMRWAVGHER